MTNTNNLQKLALSTVKWKVDLVYESSSSKTKKIENNERDFVIELSEKGEWDSTLKIKLTDEKVTRTCTLLGIQDGIFLLKKENDENNQTIKIDNDNLILSLGSSLVSVDLNKLKLNWKFKPDIAEIFEFYDLNNDYLLRGEIGIHRVDEKWESQMDFFG